MPDHISRQVLDKIARGELRMKPRWYFRAVKTVLWAGFVILLAISSIIVSAGHWFFLRHGSGQLLPYIWLLLFTFSIILAYADFRKTDLGRQQKPILAGTAILVTVILLGLAVFQTSLGRDLEPSVSRMIEGSSCEYGCRVLN